VDGEWIPSPSEGGHVDLAPRSDEEIGLLRSILEQHPGHASIERVVSGPGLLNIYRHLRAQQPGADHPDVVRVLAEDPDAAPQVISEHGMAGDCQVCASALDLFVKLYGMAAANLVLTGLAIGGLFLGGGIAPKILPRLERGDFLESFHAAGRFRELLETVPVKVILNQEAALLGASRRARREAS